MNAPFQLSQADSRPMYLQIMDNIKELVVTNSWQPGQALPSIRELAAMLKVSVITVKRAYQELEREGVITTRHGMGSFITQQTEKAAQQKQDEITQHLKRATELAQLLKIDQESLIEQLRQLLATSHQTHQEDTSDHSSGRHQ